MIHIYPLHDDKEHTLNGTQCSCEPRIEFKDPITGEYHEMLVIHNAFDFREIIEELYPKPKLIMEGWERHE